MKKEFLLPNGWKVPGVVLTCIFFVFAVLLFFNLEPFGLDLYRIIGGYFSTIVIVGFIAGMLMLGFSREKDEDEYIGKLRTSALVWAVIVNYGILIVMTLFVYDFDYVNVIVVNMFSMLIFFIAKYYYSLYKLRKSVSHEK